MGRKSLSIARSASKKSLYKSPSRYLALFPNADSPIDSPLPSRSKSSINLAHFASIEGSSNMSGKTPSPPASPCYKRETNALVLELEMKNKKRRERDMSSSGQHESVQESRSLSH